MPQGVLIALIGLLGVALSAFAGVAIKAWLDRPVAEVQAEAAEKQAETADHTFTLSEVEYWRSLVEPLRADVKRLTEALAAQIEKCDAEIAAIRTKHQADMDGKDRMYNQLVIQVGQQAMRIAALEDEVHTLGGKP